MKIQLLQLTKNLLQSVATSEKAHVNSVWGEKIASLLTQKYAKNLPNMEQGNHMVVN